MCVSRCSLKSMCRRELEAQVARAGQVAVVAAAAKEAMAGRVARVAQRGPSRTADSTRPAARARWARAASPETQETEASMPLTATTAPGASMAR